MGIIEHYPFTYHMAQDRKFHDEEIGKLLHKIREFYGWSPITLNKIINMCLHRDYSTKTTYKMETGSLTDMELRIACDFYSIDEGWVKHLAKHNTPKGFIYKYPRVFYNASPFLINHFVMLKKDNPVWVHMMRRIGMHMEHITSKPFNVNQRRRNKYWKIIKGEIPCPARELYLLWNSALQSRVHFRCTLNGIHRWVKEWIEKCYIENHNAAKHLHTVIPKFHWLPVFPWVTRSGNLLRKRQMPPSRPFSVERNRKTKYYVDKMLKDIFLVYETFVAVDNFLCDNGLSWTHDKIEKCLNREKTVNAQQHYLLQKAYRLVSEPDENPNGEGWFDYSSTKTQ